MNESVNLCSEIESEASPPPPNLKRNHAPNRLINLEGIKEIVEPQLTPCPVCYNENRTVADGTKTGFKHNLVIECETCNKMDTTLRRKITRLKRLRMEDQSRKETTNIKTQLAIAQRKLQRLRTARLGKTKSEYESELNEEKKEIEMNIRAMFASFYVGTGSQDVASILTFLGLPGGHSWHNLFHKNSETVNRRIIELCEVVVEEGLKMEIRAEIEAKLKGKYTSVEIEKYIENFINDDPDIPDDILQIGISVSYDMGWSKRSTGRVYDSLSGHGFMIGCSTGKVVAVAVRAKKCSKCSRANSNQTRVKNHICPINHSGSSGSMEATVALDLTTEIYTNSKGKVHIKELVSDDDSTMRSLLKHQTNHDKGKLSCEIPQPIFLADPSHRIKVMCKPFFKMVSNTKDPSKCKTIDALRIKKYLGCWIYKNRLLPLDQFVQKSRAPIEHLFNCHEWCDADWCWSKALTEKSHEAVKNRSTMVRLCHDFDSNFIYIIQFH